MKLKCLYLSVLWMLFAIPVFSQPSVFKYADVTPETYFSYVKEATIENDYIASESPGIPIQISPKETKNSQYYDAMNERFGESWSRRADRVAVGESQNVGRDVAVGDLVTIMGNSRLEGCAKDMVTIMGNAQVGSEGIVEGDLVTVMGSIKIEKGAIVKGDVISIMGSIDDPSGAAKKEQFSFGGIPAKILFGWGVPATIVLVISFLLFKFIARLLLSYLIMALMPFGIERIKNQFIRNPFISGGVGLGAFVAGPVIFVVFLVTCIGIILVPLAYWIAFLIGKVAIYEWLGNRIRVALGKNSRRPYLDVTIGVIVLTLVSLIPSHVGQVIEWILAFAGLGALILTRFGTREGIGFNGSDLSPASIPESPIDSL